VDTETSNLAHKLTTVSRS